MGILKDLYDIFSDLVKKRKKKPDLRPKIPEPTEPETPGYHRGSQGLTWEQYKKLFDVEGYRVSYITLMNDWKKDILFLNHSQLSAKTKAGKFRLPPEFADIPVSPEAFDGQCCRLFDYKYEPGEHLSISLQETSYFDYLKSGEQLDAPFPSVPTITNREAFGKLVEKRNGDILWPFTQLTNICGVGIFLLTSDNYILTKKISQSSHVYPGRNTFSISGVMKWGISSNPISEVIRICKNKLNYSINKNNLYLISFGADARKLYFQFSFFEETKLKSDEIINGSAGKVDIHRIPFTLEDIVNKLFEECWEPAAEAALLTICATKFEKENVSKKIFAKSSLWEKREMRDEWDYRASRPGDIPDMSLRYDPARLDSESKKYVDAVIEFMGKNIIGKNVVEIGPGTGRITQRLLNIANKVTCVDFCERMIQRSKKRLGNKFKEAHYVKAFAQEYYPGEPHEVAVCSLVLVHNISDSLFSQLVRRLCEIANKIFVFEDVDVKRPTSPRTKLRPIEDIRKAFNEYGFQLVRQRKPFYQLFSDQIAFLEFCKCKEKEKKRRDRQKLQKELDACKSAIFLNK